LSFPVVADGLLRCPGLTNCDGPGLADSNGRRQNAALKGEVRHVGIEDGGGLGPRLGIAIKAAVF